jgi:predicted AAA+ superfamily ATPase
MIKRRIASILEERLDQSAAVALVGPRQVGKTTLARAIASKRPSIYLDLESERDRSKLADPESYLEDHEDKLIVLDEVHRLPNIFQPLRSIIDRGRRSGRKTGRFLLLGSASVDLLKQSGETLAGRISYLELQPIDAFEIGANNQEALWLRGGFPESFLAASEQASMRWRLDFIRTYLERDIPQFGPRIPAETLRRFWTMLAHHQCGPLNAAQLARGLAVDGKTVANYLDLMVDLLLVRRIPPWHRNEGKRLIRSPKVLVRDSGLTHALLRIADREELLGHPVVGLSWEAFIIETLLSVAPEGTEPSFYRTSAGAEIDLVLQLPKLQVWAIEIKRSQAPKVERGFYLACEDIKPTRRFVVYSGSETYPLGNNAEAIPVRSLARLLAEFGT